MEFYTLNFLGFLIVSLVSYYVIHKDYRWLVLSGFSIFFIYSYSPFFLIYALSFTVINYIGGIIIDKNENQGKKKIYYLLFIWVDILGLIFYRYINFLIDNLNNIVKFVNIEKQIPIIENLIIPLGISYYTFQGIGYLIRVYKKQEKPELHLGFFLTYIIFFPKFISGPIERSSSFFRQIKIDYQFSYNDIIEGARRLLWGAFKKVVIANNFGQLISNIYDNSDNYSGIPLIILFFVQTLHLYFDFSGYTDMALGIAKMFGYNLMENFKRPFFATSVSDFWRKYHISLSSWCNDFIFMPTMFRRRKWKIWASIYAAFLSFFVVGIWHGANWTFIILGLLQAVAISFEFLSRRARLKFASKISKWWNNFISRILVFTFYSFTLLFFFSSSLQQVGYILSNMFKNFELKFSGYDLGVDRIDLIIAIIGCYAVIFYEYRIESGKDISIWFHKKLPRWIRLFLYYLVIFGILYYSNNRQLFVYQQF